MKRLALVIASAATAVLAAGAAQSPASIVGRCATIDHHGFHAFQIHEKRIGCHHAHRFVRAVIEHGTGHFVEQDWHCHEVVHADGSGNASCATPHTQGSFSFHFRPF